MLDLENILEMWKKDSSIDENNLDDASIQSARLHSKYLEILSVHKMILKKRESKYSILVKNKFLWYNGKLSKSEMDNFGWDYDPLNGLRVMKGDMDKFYDSDTDLIEAKYNIDELKITIETLNEIMGNVRFRGNNIKNIIEWRKFTSGA
tara:strand:- start:851 stop:1297 length:447 start_codon:yes stop_codon:yes gene_type:complete